MNEIDISLLDKHDTELNQRAMSGLEDTIWEEKPLLIRYWRNLNIRYGYGLVNVLTGSQTFKTGTGKSYCAMRIGELMDKDFGMHKIAYYPKDFISVIDRMEVSGRASQVAQVDEGEITAPAHTWQSFTNAAMAYTLSTFRYIRCNAIFCTPNFSWLDKRIRCLVNYWGVCQKRYDNKFGKTRQRVDCKFYQLKTTFMGDKLFAKRITIKTRNGVLRLGNMNVGLPSKELCEEYEKLSQSFKRDIRKKVLTQIEKFDSSKINTKRFKEYVDEIVKDNDIMEMITTNKGKISITALKDTLKDHFPELKGTEAARIKNLLEKSYGR